MNEIATKFPKWEVNPLKELDNSKPYILKTKVLQNNPLTREEKNFITKEINSNSYFKKSIPLQGWRFDFSEILKQYFVKQYGTIQEYYATDKTALRNFLFGRIEKIQEIN